MELSLSLIKKHIVAELLLIKFSRERMWIVQDEVKSFWMFYWHELKANDFRIESIINNDPEMSLFYEEWEEYDTYLGDQETRFPIISLAMKLVMAKALKYADDNTLSAMLGTLSAKFHLDSHE